MTFETFYLRAGNNDWAVAVDIWRFLMPLTSGVFGCYLFRGTGASLNVCCSLLQYSLRHTL